MIGAGQNLEAIMEDLAAIEHERWAHWQGYMFAKCSTLPNGDLVIPAELASLWQRQVETPYSGLSEQEKESDREQVRRYLPTIANYLKSVG